jgi:Ran GTPase-activating protein (RanGAP) involved in mRNA processing and transport
MQYVGDGLHHNTKLTMLNVSGNQLTCAGVTGICQGLIKKFNGNLNTLDLSRNRIADMGAARIAKMLKINRSLVNFRLDRNQITDSGAEDLL